MRAFYHPGYFLPLPEGHPFPMEKFPQAHALLRRRGVLRADQVVEVEPCSRARLERVHTPAYLQGVRDATLPPDELRSLGLPAGAALFERSCLEVEGTRLALRAALQDGLACNLAGGTHHAFAEHGEGFCILNDVAIALADLRAEVPGAADLKVLILDTDAHQGNGNHALLAADPRTFCFSIHVGRNYPSRKVPGDLDVGLERWAEGATWLQALDEALGEIQRVFSPELIVWIAGADLHRDDRFGQLRLSIEDFRDRDRRCLEWFVRDRVPMAVLYGGGYHRMPGATARLHALTVAAVAAAASARP